jgi:hypothetical protein
LENQLQDKGYEIVRNVDSLTNRIFQAVKPLPAPKDDRLITSAGASINTVTVSFSELPSMHGVLLHSSGATITPQSLYRNQNGITKLVSKADWLVLNSLSLSEKVTALKESFYYYSPFHYVLDNTSERFISRAYYLDGPKVVSKNFQAQNPPTGIQVSTASTYLLERIDQGYRLTVSTASNDNYKALVERAATRSCPLSPKTARLQLSCSAVKSQEQAKTTSEYLSLTCLPTLQLTRPTQSIKNRFSSHRPRSLRAARSSKSFKSTLSPTAHLTKASKVRSLINSSDIFNCQRAA